MKKVILVLVCCSFCFLSFPTLVNAQAEDTLRASLVSRAYNQAMDYLAAYQFDKALETFSTCYIMESENVEFLSKIAYCHFQLGRYGDSELYYKEVLKVDSLNINAISSLGNLDEKRKNYRGAQVYYGQLIKLDSTNSYYYKKSGYLALRQEKVIPAIGFFLAAYKFNKKDLEVIDVLSSMYLELNDLKSADQVLRDGLSIDADNIQLLQNLARLRQKQKKHQEVVDAVEKMMIQGDTVTYYQMLLGVAYLKIDSVEKSIEHLTAIIKRKKDNQHTHHYLGLAYFEKKDYDLSKIHIQQAIELAISPKIATYHADLATVMEKDYDYKGAIKQFEKAYSYSEDPEHLFYMARNSDLYYKDKKIAQKYYNKYLATNDQKFKQYTLDRLKQLREIIHFQVK
ncbi:MAG: tetratricopeptide repeat protein [Bacteroidota bacterium]